MTRASPAAGRSRPAAAFVAAATAFVCMLVVWHAKPTPDGNYVLLADAWRHGHAWISIVTSAVDALPYHGRAYVVQAPLPAALLLPLVAVFGPGVDQTLFSNLLGALAMFAAWRLCENVGLDRRATASACAFFFFGTSLFVCATGGNGWFLAQTSAVAFTLLALGETFGRRRAVLVAIWAVCAALSRYSLAFALPVYLAVLLARRPSPRTLERFVTPVLPAFVAAALYNYSRFKTLFDPGVWLRYRADYGATGPGAFSLANVTTQLRAQFVAAPQITSAPPWLVAPTLGFGTAYTGLPFAYAAFAGAGLEALALWTATIATALPVWLCYDPGGVQYGSRQALDFEPFLFGLLALALQRRPARFANAGLIAFAALGAYGSLVWLLLPALR